MTPGMYSAASVLDSRFKVQDTIAKNLASAQINGYKKQVNSFYGFASELYDAQATDKDGPSTASGVEEVSSFRDMSPGMMKLTNNTHDFAISGEGFFAIDTPNGKMYTRDGHFILNKDGLLITTNGFPVLSSRGPIEIPTDGTISIREDGTLIHSTEGEVGTFLIEQPKDVLQMDSINGGFFKLREGNTAKVVDAPKVVQGYIEQSNVNVPEEMVAMLENSRMAELATKVLQASDENTTSAIQDLTT